METAGRILTFDLADRVVQVWYVRLTASDEAVAGCRSILAEEEIVRTERFRFAQHRREFILAHGVLRLLLARYVGESPENIRFAYGEKQKPRLALPAAGVHFNLSHSGSIAVYAFAREVELGVDVERMRRGDDFSDLAQRFFCPEESAELNCLLGEQREQGFFRCWTRKEAYIKAVGDGLSLPLDTFRVTLRPGEPARFVHLGGEILAAQEWTLSDVPVAPGYVAAVAYRGPERLLKVTDLGDVDDMFFDLRFGSTGL